MEVYDPVGVLHRWYSGPQLLPPDRNETETGFNLALNDLEGQWIIRAVEMTNGKMIQRTIVVQGNR